MPVSELEERLSSFELAEWMAFDAIEYEEQERARKEAARR